MSHPPSMQTSIQKVKATRKERMDSLFPELNITEKAKLLERYHPGRSSIPIINFGLPICLWRLRCLD
jgi:hypothetical protein